MRKLIVGTLIGIVLSFGVVHTRRLWLEHERQAGEVIQTPLETEAAQLHRLYGPNKHSQFFEEWIIRDFFQDMPGGIFVDVGAADYVAGSNTYYLERVLGWSGVAIDAQERYRVGYEQYRPRTRYFTFFVDGHSNQKSVFYTSRIQPFVSSSSASFTRTFAKDLVQQEVMTVTLNDLLASLRLETFDFLSLDIELAEPKALAGFDIERYHPKLASPHSPAPMPA